MRGYIPITIMVEMLDIRVKKLVSLRWGGEKESEEKIQKVGSSA